MKPVYNTTAYRFPNEHLALVIGFTLLLLVIAFTAVATVCTSVVFIGLAVLMASLSSRRVHQAILQAGYPVTAASLPGLFELAQQCADRLQPGPVEVYVTPSQDMNAYTFGLESPKIVVLYSTLVETMDAGELRFVIGHELGHVKLGHTWLNSLVGGMAGIPSSSSASALLALAFLSWNRACEYSADRAGLLACGSLEKAVTALVKLVAGPQARTTADLELAYRQIDAEDDTFLGTINETLATHPLLIRRIAELRRYAGSAEYRRLQPLVFQNDRATRAESSF
jgi:Zn-dependent protease with chaperone function